MVSVISVPLTLGRCISCIGVSLVSEVFDVLGVSVTWVTLDMPSLKTLVGDILKTTLLTLSVDLVLLATGSKGIQWAF